MPQCVGIEDRTEVLGSDDAADIENMTEESDNDDDAEI